MICGIIENRIFAFVCSLKLYLRPDKILLGEESLNCATLGKKTPSAEDIDCDVLSSAALAKMQTLLDFSNCSGKNCVDS